MTPNLWVQAETDEKEHFELSMPHHHPRGFLQTQKRILMR